MSDPTLSEIAVRVAEMASRVKAAGMSPRIVVLPRGMAYGSKSVMGLPVVRDQKERPHRRIIVGVEA